jgi:hypothetical protein
MSKLRGGLGNVARSARNRLPRQPKALNQDLTPITEQLASSLLLPMAPPLTHRNDIKIQDKHSGTFEIKQSFLPLLSRQQSDEVIGEVEENS